MRAGCGSDVPGWLEFVEGIARRVELDGGGVGKDADVAVRAHVPGEELSDPS